jgi:hypothetical protein
MKITNGKDFWAGLMFIGIGLGFVFVARDYPIGTAVRMGPAYFPTMLGGLMAVLGAIIFFRSFVSKELSPVRVFPFRPLVFLAGAVLAGIALYTVSMRSGSSTAQLSHMVLSGVAIGLLFGAFGPKSLWVILTSVIILGYLLKPLGLVVATALLLFLSAMGGHEFKAKEIAVLFVVLALFSVLAFVKGLGLPMNVWPGILE